MDITRSRRYGQLLAHDIIHTYHTTQTEPAAEPAAEEPVTKPPANLSNLRKRKAHEKDCAPLPVDPLPGKRGLRVPLNPNKKEESLRKLQKTKPFWNLSWNHKRIEEQPADIEFVPILWGAFGEEEGIRQRIEYEILPAYQLGLVKRMIPFQSPDDASQSNLSVKTVKGYWDMLSSFNIPMTSPPTSNVTGSWQKQFFAAVDSQCLRLEQVAIQWYGKPFLDAFQTDITNAYYNFGKRPILITELFVIDPQATTKEDIRWSAETVLEFAKEALPWLESQDWIVGYAWLGFDTDHPKGSPAALFRPDTSLTALGLYYRSITPELPAGDWNIDINMLDDLSPPPSSIPTTSLSMVPSQSPSASSTRCNEPLAIPPMPGKKGVGLTLGRPEIVQRNVKRVRMLNPSWNYSWGPERIPDQPDDIEFIPMIWGAWGEAGLRRRLEKDILPQYKLGKVRRLLAFNEPDMEFQSNLSVDKVVEYWPVLQDARIPLATPSVAHALGDWMIDFMQQVEEKCLRAEYTAIHWYKSPNPQKFKEDITEAFYRHGERPILLTEFAVADWGASSPEENRYTAEKVLAFAKEVIPWLERQPFVAGYAWFAFNPSFGAGSSSALFDGDNSVNLTPLGRYYASVTPSNPDGDQTI